MTIANCLLLSLGAVASGAVYFIYPFIGWKFRLSVNQRWPLHFVVVSLSMMVFMLSIAIMFGEFRIIPYSLLAIIPFGLFGSFVAWAGEKFSIRNARDYKKLATEARLQGDSERAKVLEKHYWINARGIISSGGIQELDEIERMYPTDVSTLSKGEAALFSFMRDKRLFKNNK